MLPDFFRGSTVFPHISMMAQTIQRIDFTNEVDVDFDFDLDLDTYSCIHQGGNFHFELLAACHVSCPNRTQSYDGHTYAPFRLVLRSARGNADNVLRLSAATTYLLTTLS